MAARRLAAYVHVDMGDGSYKAFGPDDKVPAEVAKRITNPKAWADGESGNGEDDDAADSGYDGLKVGDLEAEVEKRNADRDPEGETYIRPEGSGKDGKVVKADLIAALEADDAANSGA